MEFIKISDNEMKVIKTETRNIEVVYNLNFLIEQRKTIQAQKEREITQRDKELTEVDDLIAKCKELGIVEKVEIKEIIKQKEMV